MYIQNANLHFKVSSSWCLTLTLTPRVTAPTTLNTTQRSPSSKIDIRNSGYCGFINRFGYRGLSHRKCITKHRRQHATLLGVTYSSGGHLEQSLYKAEGGGAHYQQSTAAWYNPQAAVEQPLRTPQKGQGPSQLGVPPKHWPAGTPSPARLPGRAHSCTGEAIVTIEEEELIKGDVDYTATHRTKFFTWIRTWSRTDLMWKCRRRSPEHVEEDLYKTRTE
jgi:hypothetical protein